MTEPSHAALISAIWNLASDPDHALDHHNGAVYWSVFGCNPAEPDGIILTIAGKPIPAWCIVHLTESVPRLMYAARLDGIPGPVHPHFAGNFCSQHCTYAFAVISGAVACWLKSKKASGRVEAGA